MADIISPEKRSELMSRVRGKDTGPELLLRRDLWARGCRYRIHYKLPGKPDLVFPRRRLAVFVDGCFWHGCPIHGETPASNTRFWREKLAENRRRDRRVDAMLRELGWTVLRYWEHDVESNTDGVANEVERALRNDRRAAK